MNGEVEDFSAEQRQKLNKPRGGYMYSTCLEDMRELIKFVELAKERFEQDPKLFSVGDVKKGAYWAIRWGITDNSMLVLKLDDDFDPILFGGDILKDYSRVDVNPYFNPTKSGGDINVQR